MATWHQLRSPAKYWHETEWTVLIDPPNNMTSIYRTSTEEKAKAYRTGLKPELARYASIIRPAQVNL